MAQSFDNFPLKRFDTISRSEFFLDFYRTEVTPPGSIGAKPHRHTFNELFFIKSGNGIHIVDFVKYPIQKNTLFVVRRGQVHYWEIEKLPEGFVILFSEELLQLFVTEHLMAELDLFRTFGEPAYYLPEEEATWFHQMMENVEGEYQNRKIGWSGMISSLVQMMIIRTQRLNYITRVENNKPTAAEGLTRQFLDLVEQYVNENLTVSQISEMIGVTSAHLTTMVRQKMGVTAGEILRNRRILEAKRLLVHSDMLVEEIAFSLNFNDPSYFGRFFKRETQLTPKQFQEQFKRKYQNV